MTSPPLAESCPSCDGSIAMDYCEICGERRPSQRAYTLREYVREGFEAVTNVERSFLKTIWTLVRKPGELVAAYMRGERVRYLKPLQLFLLVNVIFFLVGGLGADAVFATNISSHLVGPYGEVAEVIHAEREQASGMTREAYHAAFDQKTQVLARTLLFMMIPVIAIGMGVLSVRLRRRSPSVMHFVFATHLLTWVLVLSMAVAAVLFGTDAFLHLFKRRLTEETVNNLGGYLTLLGMAPYLYLAFRRAYGDTRRRALVKALLAILILGYTLVGYRLLLFLIVSYTL